MAVLVCGTYKTYTLYHRNPFRRCDHMSNSVIEAKLSLREYENEGLVGRDLIGSLMFMVSS